MGPSKPEQTPSKSPGSTQELKKDNPNNEIPEDGAPDPIGFRTSHGDGTGWGTASDPKTPPAIR